jgi:hypothetical protein
MKLTSRISRHTTPVKLPGLKPAAGEELKNELYQQKAEKGAEPSPPPAVTIPLDRVDPKYRLFDDELGAPGEPELPGLGVAAAVKEPVAAAEAPTKRVLATPDFSPSPPRKVAEPPTIPLAKAPTPTSRPKSALPPLKKPDASK